MTYTFTLDFKVDRPLTPDDLESLKLALFVQLEQLDEPSSDVVYNWQCLDVNLEAVPDESN